MNTFEFLSSVLSLYGVSGEEADAETSSYRDPYDHSVRASAVGKCPKLSAFENHDLVPAKPDFFRWVKTTQGKAWGSIFQNALLWAKRTNMGDFFSNGETFIFEKRVTRDIMVSIEGETVRVSGKPDAVLVRNGHHIPIEFKNSEWLRESSVLQVITYMMIYQEMTGYMVTLDSHRAKVRVYEVGDIGWGYVIKSMTEPPKKTDMTPTPFSGMFEIAKSDYFDLVQAHEDWNEFLDNDTIPYDTVPAGYTPTHRHCATFIPEEVYKRKTTRGDVTYVPGDVKPNTGVIYPRCPLYDKCWGVATVVDTALESEDNDWSYT